jgi:hypothetical protein
VLKRNGDATSTLGGRRIELTSARTWSKRPGTPPIGRIAGRFTGR